MGVTIPKGEFKRKWRKITGPDNEPHGVLEADDGLLLVCNQKWDAEGNPTEVAYAIADKAIITDEKHNDIGFKGDDEDD